MKQIYEVKEQEPRLFPKYIWHDAELRQNGKLMVGNVVDTKQQLLQHFHGSAIRDHSGTLANTRGSLELSIRKGCGRMRENLFGGVAFDNSTSKEI